mgnify:CR=1 FL=1
MKTNDMFPLDDSILRQIEAESDDMHWMCKVWQCNFCNDVSLTKQGWRDHVCEVQELLLCAICGSDAQFSSEGDLQEHYQLIHGEDSIDDERYSMYCDYIVYKTSNHRYGRGIMSLHLI